MAIKNLIFNVVILGILSIFLFLRQDYLRGLYFVEAILIPISIVLYLYAATNKNEAATRFVKGMLWFVLGIGLMIFAFPFLPEGETGKYIALPIFFLVSGGGWYYEMVFKPIRKISDDLGLDPGLISARGVRQGRIVYVSCTFSPFHLFSKDPVIPGTGLGQSRLVGSFLGVSVKSSISEISFQKILHKENYMNFKNFKWLKNYYDSMPELGGFSYGLGYVTVRVHPSADSGDIEKIIRITIQVAKILESKGLN